MSAVEALKAARAAGTEVALDGGDLAVSAASAPPAAVLDALSRHKAEIVALLQPGDSWSGEDWQVYFDERAGIAQFDGGLQRAEAEVRAFKCCVVEWLNRNPVRSPPGRCLGCGGSDDAVDQLLPYGTEPSGPAWLHSRCWAAWHAKRKAEAVAVLSPTLGPADGQAVQLRTAVAPCARWHSPRRILGADATTGQTGLKPRPAGRRATV
jgi:hypothetical protein